MNFQFRPSLFGDSRGVDGDPGSILPPIVKKTSLGGTHFSCQGTVGGRVDFGKNIHPRKLTWIPKMMVWKR